MPYGASPYPRPGLNRHRPVDEFWVKAFYHRGEHPELYYWQDKSGLEVDLIIDRNGLLYPIEIKATATLLPGHAESLLKWKELAGKSAAKGLIVANIDHPWTFKDIQGISWQRGLG